MSKIISAPTQLRGLLVIMKKTIYIFGNPLLDFDSLPIELKPELEKRFPEIDFKIMDPNENLKPINGELIIIDTVEGINEVVVIDDIEKIKAARMYSAHDLDLGFNLQLLYNLGELKKVIIFGVPMEIEKEAALGQLVNEIEAIVGGGAPAPPHYPRF